MPNLVYGGVTFVLTDDWVDMSQPAGPNGYPLKSDGTALASILGAIFAGTESSAFLSKLSGKTFYVVAGAADETGKTEKNAAMYTRPFFRSIGWPGGVKSSDTAAKKESYNLVNRSRVGGAPLPASPDGILFIGKDLLPSMSTPIKTPSGTANIETRRIIFHELAHAVTLPSGGLGDRFTNSATKQYHFEDIAIAAENYIYRKDFGGPVRVGHDSASVPASTFDPTLPFSGDTAAVKYSRGSDGDAFAHVFTQTRTSADTSIIKTYHSDTFAPGKHGSYNNYVTVRSIGATALLSEDSHGAVSRSTALNSVIAGVASKDAADRIDEAVAARDEAKAGASTLLSWNYIQNAVSTPGVEWLTKTAKIRLDDIYRSKGLTNEVSASNALVVGPQVADTNKKATYLDLSDQAGSIIFGASGFNQKSVNFTDMVDAIEGSDDKDLILVGQGRVNTPQGQARIRNTVDAKAGDDIVLGGERDDNLTAGEGDDIVVASKGDDILAGGGGRDILILGDDLRRAVVSVESSGAATMTAGNGNKSVTAGFEMFVGGAQRVTFKQVADINGVSPALFVAGSGGADFYLERGGIAVGRDDVTDNFYLSDGVPEGFTGDREAYLKSNQCVLVNVDAEDKIFVRNKAGAWVQFTGAQTTSTLLPKLSPGFAPDASGGGAQLTGTSAYDIEYAQLHERVGTTNYEFDEETHQRTVTYIPLEDVAEDLGVITFADYSDGLDGRTLNNYLNVVIDFRPSSAGLNFSRDSLSPILPFEYAPTFYDQHGLSIFFSHQYQVGVEYDEYDYYSLTSEDRDWFLRDEAVYGYSENYPEEDAVDWAENESLIFSDGFGYGLAALSNILDSEVANFDLTDPAVLLSLFGEDALSGADADLTLRVDPLLGLSVGADFQATGEWRQLGAAVNTLATSLGTLTFSGDGVTLVDFVIDPAALLLTSGAEIDLGTDMWGTFVPSDPADGSPVSSYIGAVVRQFFPLDEDARPNQINVTSIVGAEVGIDAALGSAGMSITGSFTYSLATDLGGAFAIDSATGVVTVGDTAALSALAGTTAALTVRVSTPFGHRDTEFTVTISGDQSYNPVAGTGSDDVLAGTSGSDHVLSGDGDDIVDAGTGNDLVEGGAGSNILAGGGGNDILVGGDEADDLSGGAGSDVLAGNGGANIIRFGLGDGNDVVRALSTGFVASASSTTIVFGPGIIAEDLSVSVSADGLDIIVRLTATGEGLVLEGGFGNAAAFGTLGFAFDDASTLSIEDIAALAAAGTLGVNRSAIDGQVNVLIGSAEADTLQGGTANDQLVAGAGSDHLDGGVGADRMAGGAGDDVYVVDSLSDTVIEATSDGFDTVRTDLGTYITPDNVEAVVYTGSTDFAVLGNALDNVFLGGSGNDAFTGGSGNDRYYVSQSGDAVVELIDGGHDEVVTDLGSATLADNVEDLTYIGDGDFTGNGNESDNRIVGGVGDDILNGDDGNDELVGGSGADLMTGGAGSDTYYVDDAGDVVVEAAGEGRDQVVTSLASYNLGSEVEDLAFTGTDDFVGEGNSADNEISGGSGNDQLSGGLGNDTLAGGFGDDTYVVEASGDIVIENVDAGYDTVLSSADYTLSENIEELVFTGTGAFTGIGNDLDNYIVGGDSDDILSGGAGNDFLEGGLGADTLTGGSGDDTFTVDNVGDVVVETAAGGSDWIVTTLDYYALDANLENLSSAYGASFEGVGNARDNILQGNAEVNLLTGGAGDDTYFDNTGGTTIVENAGEGTDTVHTVASWYALGDNVENLVFGGNNWSNTGYGNALDNVIEGAFGANYLEGGAGNDTYVLKSFTDEVVEFAGEGDDEIRIEVEDDNGSFTLGENIERLTYVGNFDFVGTGNALDNVLTGDAGNDWLDGGAGADTLVGGRGDDNYFIDDAGDQVIEQIDSGFDMVETGLNVFVLPANVEGVRFTGTGSFHVTGGAGDDLLIGGLDADTLAGGDGNDVLDGGGGEGFPGGADTLSGGNGNDSYLVDDAADVVIELAGAGEDTVLASVGYTLGANIENLRLSGFGNIAGTGNALNNVIEGGAGDNVIDGGAGADRMSGGDGDDVYYVDDAGDVVEELARAGTDEVRTSFTSFTLAANLENLTYLGSASFTGTGNALGNRIAGGGGADYLSGGGGNDELAGGSGADTMVGGAGDDIYHVDDAGDLVTEGSESGRDKVFTSTTAWSLGANVEDLVYVGASGFTAIGNGRDNTITTGIGDDQIDAAGGNDTIISIGGNDVISAGDGMDYVDAGAGQDEISGGSGNDKLYAGSGDDIVYGGDGDDYISAGSDVDSLFGGAGDDIYEIDGGDTVVEYAGEGIDTIITDDGYTLGANIENLTVTAYWYAYGVGNALNNIITGSYGDNGLSGLGGDDTLFGESGYDTLTGGDGDDILDGGGSTDTAVFRGEVATYSIVTSGGSVSVVDNDAIADGDDGSDTLIDIEYAYFLDGGVSLAAPLVFDLNGNGVGLTSISDSAARFDFDGDGVRTRTSWIESGDGLLFYDRNRDGGVTGDELSFVSDRKGAKSDLEGLATYDRNLDGVLSADDDAFSGFGVWADRNVDGQVDAGEVLTLAEAGIASINLHGDAVSRTWSFGDAIVVNDGAFTRTDGSTGAFADVVFTYGDDTLRFSAAARASQLVEASAAMGRRRAAFTTYLRASVEDDSEAWSQGLSSRIREKMGWY